MIRFILILTVIVITKLLVFSSAAYAHPGRTASDGCHYCRTNCDSWGVAWNARHCHGGASIPLIIPTSKPIPKKINTPTSTKPLLEDKPNNESNSSTDDSEGGVGWLLLAPAAATAFLLIKGKKTGS